MVHTHQDYGGGYRGVNCIGHHEHFLCTHFFYIFQWFSHTHIGGRGVATMDIIKLRGGAPANFLDVGATPVSNRWVVCLLFLSETPM